MIAVILHLLAIVFCSFAFGAYLREDAILPSAIRKITIADRTTG